VFALASKLASLPQNKKAALTFVKGLHLFRREDRIRTCDPLVPNQVRYRPALLPDPTGICRNWECKYKGFLPYFPAYFKKETK